MSGSTMIAAFENYQVAAHTADDEAHSRIPGRLWHQGLYGPLEDFVQRKGKRIRADLIELSYRAAGGTGEVQPELIEFIELLHGGSLIIDDIEDDSSSRRGEEALHQRVGLPIALNTGNWMYFSALEKLMLLRVSDTMRSRVTQLSLRTIRRCHEGQALDLAARVDELHCAELMPTADSITRLKTGGLTALAARLGGIAAGASPSVCDLLAAFGMQLGRGLQMQNDLSELHEAQLPGGRSDDLRNRRVTWPWAWYADCHSPAQLQALQQKLTDPETSNSEVAWQLVDGIDEWGRQRVNEVLQSAPGVLRQLDAKAAGAVATIIGRLVKNHV